MDLNLLNGTMDDGFAVGNYSREYMNDLAKALEAGDSVDPAQMGTGGNTLQFQSLESGLVSALAERPADFKLMNLQPRNKVGSTAHQYSLALNSGSYDGVGTQELGDPIESVSDFARITRNIKYYQTKREASLQTNQLSPIVGGKSGEAVEERMGIHVILKANEAYCFHGNESVSPNLPDGYPTMIRNEAPQNVIDMKGLRLTDENGLGVFEEAIRAVSEQGGEITDAFFPYALAVDWQNVLRDRYRYNDDARIAGSKLTTFQSMYGTDIHIAGRAGIDKMYKEKGVPLVSDNRFVKKPNAPSFTLTAQPKTGGTGFVTANAGTYRYTAYAVSEEGLVSDSAAPQNIAVASGDEVAVAITPDGVKPGSGFIVCRGKKDDTTSLDIREMIKIANSQNATTTFLDQNDELPGTLEMLLLTTSSLEETYQWDSFMDIRRWNLGPTRASIPFLVLSYGTPDLKIAKFNALIKNVSHPGVANWN